LLAKNNIRERIKLEKKEMIKEEEAHKEVGECTFVPKTNVEYN